MNENAIAKLGEAKFCILFCLVPRASVPHGTEEHCMSVGLLHATPWSFSFYFLQMVSRQQILEACLRIFLNAFHICLEISCSHPCLRKINLKGSKAMDPRLLAIILFHHFFSREIYIF